jgi:NAD-dependent DNA ligase
MRRAHNIKTMVTTCGFCHAHSNRHMDMFRAKCRNAALPAMHIAPIRWDASHSQIRIEILASKIFGRTRQANSIVRALEFHGAETAE